MRRPPAGMMAEKRRIIIPYAPRPTQLEMHRAMERFRFAVLVAHRRLGKTVCAVNHLIKQALTARLPDSRYAYVAPFRKQAKLIAWDYLKRYTAVVPGRTINESELWVGFPNGSRIQIHGADNPDSLRGVYFDGIVLDEVAQMKPEVWGEIIRPALADRKGFAVFIGTPKGMNLFYELFSRAKTTPGWFAGVWRVDQTGAIDEEELAAIRAELSPNQYRQEFLCDFSASADDVLITIDMAEAATNRVLMPGDVRGSEKVIGVDVARFGDDSTVLTKRHGLYVYEQLVWHGLRTDEVADRVANIIQEFQPDATFIDATGLGAGVVDNLIRWNHQVTGIDAASSPRRDKVYRNKRAEMWGDTKDRIKAGLKLPKDSDLITDLTTPRYWYSEPGNRIQLESKKQIKERIGRSPDRADSLVLTFAAPVMPKSDMEYRLGAGRNGFGTADEQYDLFA